MSTPTLDPASRLKANIVEPEGDGVRVRHALLIGIDIYDDPELRLEYSVRDVKALARTLAARGYRVTALHDGLAPDLIPTLANVKRALKAFITGPDADDLLLVYFSCHGKLVGDPGAPDGERPYLLMRDTGRSDAAIRKHGLALSEILATLRAGAPRWIAVFLDACHMGLGVDPDTGTSTRHIEKLAGGFALLAGSTAAQITQDSEQRKAGIFSGALVEGLSGAAAEPDGRVLFSSLAHYVQRTVAAWRRSREGRNKLASQTPVLRLELADLELVPPLGHIALTPGHTAPRSDAGLSNKIRAAAFSPDGRWLVTASEDFTARLWNPATGKAGPGPMPHPSHVGGIAFAPDSLVLVSACNDGYARLWQAPGASLVTPAPEYLDARLHAAAWSPRSPRFAIVSARGVHVYDADRPERPIHEPQGHRGMVWSVAFSPGDWLVTGGDDGTARIWDTETGAAGKVLQVGGPVWAVAVSPDGKWIATGGADAKAGPTLTTPPRVWSARTGKAAFSLVGHARAVTAVSFSPDGKRIATTSYDGTARLWDASDGHALATFSPPDAPEAYGAAFSPDGRALFVGFTDGRGLLYDIASEAPGHGDDERAAAQPRK